MMGTNNPQEIVLVVDDSPESLGFLTDALEVEGFTVLVALSGEMALNLVDKIEPDVILMDAIMPGMDGFETCRQLKHNRKISHIPLIFMTGLSETEHIVKGFEVGGVDYVTKPIIAEEMIVRIRAHVANARVTHNSQLELDNARRYLLAADVSGMVTWSTPQAGELLERQIPGLSRDGQILAPEILPWIQSALTPNTVKVGNYNLSIPDDARLTLCSMGAINARELLIRIIENDATKDQARLVSAFGLTAREAEVLVWIAFGKSNKEIGEILGLSPRTVNKHLEPIFEKLGVENRTSAAACAIRALWAA